ncbi:MAG: hypothetical protein ACOCW8_00480 [bacterium]
MEKLIRVLTHEIMNSVTPINTLVKTMVNFFKSGNNIITIKEINDEIIQETVEGLEMVEERGEGLIEFMKKYRSISKIPRPNPVLFPVSELFGAINKLFSGEFEAMGISFHCLAEPKDIKLLADKRLIEQVLINLVKNL